MGVLPLVFKPGESRKTLGLNGTETIDIVGLSDDLTPRQELTVNVTRADGSQFSFQAIARVDSPVDIEYLRHGGVLPFVLRNLMSSAN